MPVTFKSNESALKHLAGNLAGSIAEGVVVCPELFYYETEGLKEKELTRLRSLTKKALEELKIDPSVIRKELGYLFLPWTRLQGRIDAAISWNELDRVAVCDETTLSTILSSFANLPEYKEQEVRLKWYAYDFCKANHLDYTSLPEDLKNPDLVMKFKKEYPYLAESREWDMLGEAYRFGNKMAMTLREEPDFTNGYIGGKVNWSKYLALQDGPRLSIGKVTGLGQIDYKDCTNAYVIIGKNERAVDIYALSPLQRRLVLKASHLKCQQLKKDVSNKVKV